MMLNDGAASFLQCLTQAVRQQIANNFMESAPFDFLRQLDFDVVWEFYKSLPETSRCVEPIVQDSWALPALHPNLDVDRYRQLVDNASFTMPLYEAVAVSKFATDAEISQNQNLRINYNLCNNPHIDLAKFVATGWCRGTPHFHGLNNVGRNIIELAHCSDKQTKESFLASSFVEAHPLMTENDVLLLSQGLPDQERIMQRFAEHHFASGLSTNDRANANKLCLTYDDALNRPAVHTCGWLGRQMFIDADFIRNHPTWKFHPKSILMNPNFCISMALCLPREAWTTKWCFGQYDNCSDRHDRNLQYCTKFTMHDTTTKQVVLDNADMPWCPYMLLLKPWMTVELVERLPCFSQDFVAFIKKIASAAPPR
jgi:hypothetical protein